MALIIAVCLMCLAGAAAEAPISLRQGPAAADLSTALAKYYTPVPVQVTPQIPSYPLPLSPDKIQNWREAVWRIALGDEAQKKLKANGLVTRDWGKQDDVVKAYVELKARDIPVFVTSDSILHLYHLKFDKTLENTERAFLAHMLRELSLGMEQEMADRARQTIGEAAQAYWLAAAYFAVPLKLLDPDAEVPAEVNDVVAWEVAHIERAGGFPEWDEASRFSLFKYKEDYSQYKPRGHYTRGKDLQQYFKAMMWYGRMTFLVNGDRNYGPDGKALVSEEQAKIQTLAAAAISAALGRVRLKYIIPADKDSRVYSTKLVGERPVAFDETAADTWRRIYTVTAFFVGASDDLGPPEYFSALRGMFGEQFSLARLSEAYPDFKKKLSAMKKTLDIFRRRRG